MALDLKTIELTAASCTLCELCKGRIKPVFAKGSPASEVVICGMCPGPDENEAGIPFVGAAGGILDAILLEAFGKVSSSLDVYITNLVKCFVPPGTKLDPKWMGSCLPYFLVQLKLIDPKVIITLGKDVSNFLLNNEDSMGSMRGNIYNYMGIKLISTYHPSYLARGGGVKHRHFDRVVKDFEKALYYLGG
jgi:uracil-DNA glycosylase family 4